MILEVKIVLLLRKKAKNNDLVHSFLNIGTLLFDLFHVKIYAHLPPPIFLFAIIQQLILFFNLN